MADAADLPAPGEAVLELAAGTVTIRLREDLAPGHVERIRTLANDGFYDGIIWHRVIPGFMAQTGDPTGTGRGGSDLPDSAGRVHDRSDRSRAGPSAWPGPRSPDTANSQFFICFADCSFLDGQYTIWGEVIDGMDAVDQIAVGEPPPNPDTDRKCSASARQLQ